VGRLDGKVALISGAARGMGASEADLFAREGAKVVLGDILDDVGEATSRAIRARGGEATYVHLDVTAEEHWRLAVALAEDRYGKLNILVNNAGIAQPRVSLEDMTEEQWDRVMAVNLKGTFFGTKTAIPALRRAGGGSIINTSSTAGIVASGGAAYGASKGGVRLLTKTVAMLYAKDGIRCNSIHPGPVDTDTIRASQADPVAWAARVNSIPLKRVGLPEEIAYGVLYLASDESLYVSGSELVIDGGLTAT
jgi:NAD(P)-dependent dehydrogenase (short-subunit alcohol dehydrogenase family)